MILSSPVLSLVLLRVTFNMVPNMRYQLPNPPGGLFISTTTNYIIYIYTT